ncbi:hypothetical protein KQX54_002378 [Cotesia glomerata]|uniref:Sema domain-containing protein n=1 Tax=Cotesia glomerata TaxID=32391 RepID=A0AAV7I8F6_COTGL|nr:hypothetical protein KQX54_002378 [Cotesia glomerata]
MRGVHASGQCFTREVIGQRFLGNESHVEHFKLLERAPTFILIGARNAIYNISLHDLSEIADQESRLSTATLVVVLDYTQQRQAALTGHSLSRSKNSPPFAHNLIHIGRLHGSRRVQWSSSAAHREMCNLKGASEDDCQNYVRVFGRQGPNKFIACGTNAYKPQCKQFLRTCFVFSGFEKREKALTVTSVTQTRKLIKYLTNGDRHHEYIGSYLSKRSTCTSTLVCVFFSLIRVSVWISHSKHGAVPNSGCNNVSVDRRRAKRMRPSRG